jgi:hypothetical protein
VWSRSGTETAFVFGVQKSERVPTIKVEKINDKKFVEVMVETVGDCDAALEQIGEYPTTEC